MPATPAKRYRINSSTSRSTILQIRFLARLDAEPVKSVGNGTTFPQNLTTRIQVRSGIAVLADSVATRLRREGLYAGGIQVTVRDPAFHDR